MAALRRLKVREKGETSAEGRRRILLEIEVAEEDLAVADIFCNLRGYPRLGKHLKDDIRKSTVTYVQGARRLAEKAAGLGKEAISEEAE